MHFIGRNRGSVASHRSALMLEMGQRSSVVVALCASLPPPYSTDSRRARLSKRKRTAGADEYRGAYISSRHRVGPVLTTRWLHYCDAFNIKHTGYSYDPCAHHQMILFEPGLNSGSYKLCILMKLAIPLMERILTFLPVVGEK